MARGSLRLGVADLSQMLKVNIMQATLLQQYITFLQPRDLVRMILQFQVTERMPGMVSYNDGSHVPIRSPGGYDAERYRCKKVLYTSNA